MSVLVLQNIDEIKPFALVGTMESRKIKSAISNDALSVVQTKKVTKWPHYSTFLFQVKIFILFDRTSQLSTVHGMCLS